MAGLHRDDLGGGSSLGAEARARVRAFFAPAAEGIAPPRWDLVCGESLALLTHVPSGSVQAVAGDGPYSSGGAFRGDRAQGTGQKYVKSETVREDRLQDRFVDYEGDTRDQLSFVHWATLWMAECLRVADKGAIGAFWTDWRQVAATIAAFQAGGWVYRGLWGWDKTLEVGDGRRYLGFEVVPRIHGEAHARLSARTGAPVPEGAAIAGDGQKHGRRRKGAGGGQLLLGETAK